MSSINILEAIVAKSKLSKKETAKQQKIVESAIALFAEKGYSNTSTSEIAKKSGVAEGTIFRHYGTKENLLLSVIAPFLKESMPDLAKDLREEVNPDNNTRFEDFIESLIRNRLNFLKANREIFRVVIKELLYRDELRYDLFPHIGKEMSAFIGNAINDYKARGELADIPNDQLIRMILSTIGSQFVVRFVLSPETNADNEEREIESLVRFIVYGVSARD
ncbi:TetR/AcrR family transcriptional regulator [Cohnella herbarum]|uniref:TetR/AcrR family transcriptional regulator n=1 Tax=Cohnella herbarum TaxID=2728023 RepID=A0A7Z2VH27_9BACL|nr:TetR/AcrR family transcriptional regulator [Cohnella herbarum]QJD83081.1 TetR/AcrR family transcriptional regulator [Cohnella herbarum]